MKRLGILSLVAISLAVAASGQAPSRPETEIKAVLDFQQAAWNRGDIDGFMAFYWKSDDLTFQSGNSRTHGWSDVLARYKKTYPSGKMGKLAFADLAFHVLSPDSAFVLGRFKLDRDGTLSEGVFTLVLKRTGDGWRIIHDHTSSK
jgi:beta-aspartyl-peptidase (threonine type)